MGQAELPGRGRDRQAWLEQVATGAKGAGKQTAGRDWVLLVARVAQHRLPQPLREHRGGSEAIDVRIETAPGVFRGREAVCALIWRRMAA